MPTYRPPYVGLQYTEALVDTYVHTPADDPVMLALELHHEDWAEPIRIVNQWEALDATLEDDAPVNGGEVVTFAGIPFDHARAAETDSGAPAPITFTVDNLSTIITQMIMEVQESEEPIQVYIRTYLRTDTSAPHELPVVKMWVQSPVQITGSSAQLSCSFGDLTNRRFPRLLWRRFSVAATPSPILLLHGEGADGSTTIIDSSSYGRVPTSNIGVTIQTEQSLFGSASILAPLTESDLPYPSSTDFRTEPPYTIEFAIRLTEYPVSSWYLMGKDVPAPQYFSVSPAGLIVSAHAGASRAIGTLALNTWYRVATVLESIGPGGLRVYLDGTYIGAAEPTLSSGAASRFSPVSIPGDMFGNKSVRAYLDEVRYTRAALYGAANYTLATGPFPNP